MSEASANHDDLIERLAALLDLARARICSALTAARQPLTVFEERPSLERSEPGAGWVGRQVSTEVNVLAHSATRQLQPEVLAEWLVEARSLARELASRFPGFAVVGSAFAPTGLGLAGIDWHDIDRNDDAQCVLALAIMGATEHYVVGLPTIEYGNLSIAWVLSSEVVRLVSTKRFTARQFMAIAGIEPKEDLLEVSRQRLRALTASERGHLVEWLQPRRGESYLGGPLRFVVATHALEVDTEIEQPNDAGLLTTPPLVTALQLHNVEFTGAGAITTRLLPEWWPGVISIRLFPTKEYTSSICNLSAAQFEEICQTAVLLEPFRLDSPGRPSELALQRFSLGCGRRDAVDGILDFVIALEALLLPYDTATRFSDLSYRFRVHGAYYIADNLRERRPIFRTLSILYNIRSRIVHGDNYPDPAEAMAAANQGRQLAARGLLKAVQSGFPDPEIFNRMVLGETTPV